MRYLIAFALLLLTARASAQSALYGVPNFTLMHPSNTLQETIMGSTCFSMPASPLELSCNPAFLASEDKRQFRFNIVGNDKIAQINKYRLLLERNDTFGIVDGLLQEKEPLIAGGAVSAWYQHDWWAIGVVPIRAGYASFYRNSSYPEMFAHVFAEKEVFAKAGMKVAGDPNIRLGVQGRYVERDFFRKQFALLDAITDPDIIRIEKQKAFYLEPGFTYAFNEKGTNALSAMFSNLAVYQSGEIQPVRPVFDLGFTTSPEFANGHLKTSTHFSNNPDVNDVFELFKAGLVYDFNSYASLSGSIGKKELGVGVSGHVESLVLGLGYRTEEIYKDDWQTARVSTWLGELGLVF